MPILTAASPPPAGSHVNDHCVGRLEYVSSGSNVARLAAENCFTTFNEAFTFATSPETPDSTVIGVDFDAANYNSD